MTDDPIGLAVNWIMYLPIGTRTKQFQKRLPRTINAERFLRFFGTVGKGTFSERHLGSIIESYCRSDPDFEQAFSLWFRYLKADFEPSKVIL